MRVPVEYVALAIAGLGYSASEPPSSVEVAAATPSCWAPNTVSASYGPLKDLRTDAYEFCNQFSTNSTAIVTSSGKFIFGWQSAMFVGNFANWTSCMNTFNSLVTKCYGTASPTRPTTLGGTNVDPGGANLVISFGNGLQL